MARVLTGKVMHHSINSIHFVILTSLNINNVLLRNSARWFCCNEPDFPDLNPESTPKTFAFALYYNILDFFFIFIFYFLPSHLTYIDRSHAVRHIHKSHHRRRFDLIISHHAVKGCQSKNFSVVRKRQLYWTISAALSPHNTSLSSHVSVLSMHD